MSLEKLTKKEIITLYENRSNELSTYKSMLKERDSRINAMEKRHSEDLKQNDEEILSLLIDRIGDLKSFKDQIDMFLVEFMTHREKKYFASKTKHLIDHKIKEAKDKFEDKHSDSLGLLPF